MPVSPYGYDLPPTPPAGQPPQPGEAAYEFPHLAEAFEARKAWAHFALYPEPDRSSSRQLQFISTQVCSDASCFQVDRLLQEGGGGIACLTIIDILHDGALRHAIFRYLPALHGMATGNTLRPFVADCIAKLVNVPDHLSQRIVLVDICGQPALDLYTLDMLYGAYQIDLSFLWSAYRQHNELRGPLQQATTSSSSPLFLENMHIPWRRPNCLSIGGTQCMFLQGVESPLSDGKPLAIMIYQYTAKPNNEYDPYSAIATNTAEDSYSANAIVAEAIWGYATQKYAEEAREIGRQTVDDRKALLTVLLKLSIDDKLQTCFDACLKAMIQLQVAEGKAVLIRYLAGEPTRRPIKEAWKPRKEEAQLWTTLERLQQQLEHQSAAINRFKCKNAKVAKVVYQIEDEVDEFDSLLKEMRTAVEHQRGRLDHELNETLLRESRANLTIARQTIKENQRNGLLTFLAFIFVPFSLTTSVFGMNLQELNQTGQSLKVFGGTTVVLFICSLLLWAFASTLVTAYTNFKRRHRALGKDLIDIQRHSYYLGFDRLKALRIRWMPSRIYAIFRKGLTLGVLTRGHYDPKAFEISELDIDLRRKSLVVDAPMEDRWSREVKYLLGLKRIPEEEDYSSLWKVRNDDHRRPSF